MSFDRKSLVEIDLPDRSLLSSISPPRGNNVGNLWGKKSLTGYFIAIIKPFSTLTIVIFSPFLSFFFFQIFVQRITYANRSLHSKIELANVETDSNIVKKGTRNTRSNLCHGISSGKSDFCLERLLFELLWIKTKLILLQL